MKIKSKALKWLLPGIILLSCNTNKKTTGPLKNDPVAISKNDETIARSPGDGKSYETAIVIQETTESAGIHAEYQWIRDHFADYKVVRQSLNYYKKKPFDVITIQFNDDRKQDVYFDISKFFK